MQQLGRQQYSSLIELSRPLLIILVCWAHTPFLVGYQAGLVSISDPETLLGAFLRDVVSRGAVPLLTVISGYLAFSSLQRKPYSAFLRDKVKRILAPFILWNVIVLALLWITLEFGGYAIDRDARSYNNTWDGIRGVLGLHRLPTNPPLYFLRDLFLILMICPLLDWLSRLKPVAITFLLIYTIYMFNTVTPSAFGYGILYRSDMPFFFFIGYLAARYELVMPVTSNRAILIALGLLTAFSIATTYYLSHFKPDLIAYLKFRPIIGIVFLILTPCIFSLLFKMRDTVAARVLKYLAPYSFIIFLSHYLAVLGFKEITKYAGISIHNESHLAVQGLALILYTLLCIGVGITIKQIYPGARSAGGLPSKAEPSR